ncbi:MAG TPA: nicotinate phosphoribosyltransferase [Bryobacteraceae bacterium]|nr:nicotinate phosphoribosyltransferase [Bryobacteraceae bacterium]HPU71811.1 nicotinate phosphoribosyltransferase [Bryobacteraceae bacterium]
MNALLTDLYELTMSAGYFEAGITHHIATFELSVRRLPPNRGFLVAAGLPQVVDYLLGLRFGSDEIDYLRSLPQFARVSPGFFEALRGLRFTGDLFAVPEGTPVFAGEPILTVRAPLIEAQLPETWLLSMISFQTMVAAKAARVVEAAAGRAVVEFGSRRAHSPEAGVLAGRAAYIGGCAGTSNTLTGFRFGIPVFGTAAHSWVQAFPTELEAQKQLQKLLGEGVIYLIDTFDTVEGARKAASLGMPIWGVRLDSGDLIALSRTVRQILDDAGLTGARIMASGDLNEYKIRDIVAAGAPIDAFGVGTELATSSDAPALSAIYKLVEIEADGVKRYTAKFSKDKNTLPGAKQIFRYPDRDVVGLAGEPAPVDAEKLLRPVILSGKLVEPLPGPQAARDHALRALARLPEVCRRLDNPEPFPVEYSRELTKHYEAIKMDHEGSHG